MLVDDSLHDCFRSIFQSCGNLEAVDYTHASQIAESTRNGNSAFQEGLLPVFDGFNYSDPYSNGLAAMCELVKAAAKTNFKPKRLRLGCVSHRLLADARVSRFLPEFFQIL